MSDPSVYIECNLLLAVMDEDWTRAQRLLDRMSPNERRTLSNQLRVLRMGLVDGDFHARDERPAMLRAIRGEDMEGERPASEEPPTPD